MKIWQGFLLGKRCGIIKAEDNIYRLHGRGPNPQHNPGLLEVVRMVTGERQTQGVVIECAPQRRLRV